eukprot:2007244-Amphidinium_carterae.1
MASQNAGALCAGGQWRQHADGGGGSSDDSWNCVTILSHASLAAREPARRSRNTSVVCPRSRAGHLVIVDTTISAS